MSRPSPNRQWLIAQEWHHVLFLHWPIDPAALRRFVPSPLEIDTHDGRAWLTVLPFAMRRLRVRGLPPIPWLSAFPQLNVRTYVTLDGRPGVFLLRVVAGRWITVAIARRLFHLPFERGSLSFREHHEDHEFSCRTETGHDPLAITVRYRPGGEAFRPAVGSRDHWLTERFCYYTVGSDGLILRGEIDHPPWSLRLARMEILASAWPAGFGFLNGVQPALIRYSSRQTATSWSPKRVARTRS